MNLATPSCPTCGFSKTVITTPGGEQPGSRHPMIWDAVNQRWIDVAAEEENAKLAAAAPAAAPAATGFVIPSVSIYIVVAGAIIAGIGGYYLGKRGK